mgnify:CR=1 FL=1
MMRDIKNSLMKMKLNNRIIYYLLIIYLLTIIILFSEDKKVLLKIRYYDKVNVEGFPKTFVLYKNNDIKIISDKLENGFTTTNVLKSKFENTNEITKLLEQSGNLIKKSETIILHNYEKKTILVDDFESIRKKTIKRIRFFIYEGKLYDDMEYFRIEYKNDVYILLNNFQIYKNKDLKKLLNLIRNLNEIEISTSN